MKNKYIRKGNRIVSVRDAPWFAFGKEVDREKYRTT